jgi:hypothetical protein
MGAQVVTAASQAIAPAGHPLAPITATPTSRKMHSAARSARRSRHFSEVGGASGVNSGDLPGRIVKIISHGFVEANDHPAHFGACSVTVLIPALGEVTAVEPRRPRFDGETDVGPRDVQVDRLTGWQDEPMLTNRAANADHFELVDEVALEVALGGPSLTIGTFQPGFDLRNPVLAATPVLLQILSSSRWRDEPQVPCVLRGSFESVLVERSSQAEQGAHR